VRRNILVSLPAVAASGAPLLVLSQMVPEPTVPNQIVPDWTVGDEVARLLTVLPPSVARRGD